MVWHDVHDPLGRLLFRYDVQRSLIEIESEGLGWLVIDLERYRQPIRVPIQEISTSMFTTSTLREPAEDNRFGDADDIVAPTSVDDAPEK